MEEAVVALCGRARFFFWLWDAEGVFFFFLCCRIIMKSFSLGQILSLTYVVPTN